MHTQPNHTKMVTVDNRTFSTGSSSSSSCVSSLIESQDYNDVELHNGGFNCDRNNVVSKHTYFSTSLPRELASCLVFFIVGVYSPSYLLRPIFGMNIRPIPYQILPNSNDVILDFSLNQPLVEDVTVGSKFLFHSSVTIPILIVFLVSSILAPRFQPKYHDVHASICVLLTTIGMSEFITQLAKFYVGRLRPNFYELCGFDKSQLTCTNPIDMVMEGRCSFPSGHSSISASGMGALVYFFLGRVGIAAVCSSGSKNSTLSTKVKALLALSPLTYSTFCACSRLFDNWHHPSDVVGGICLGLFCCTVSYHLWYPSVLSEKYAGMPLSYVSALNLAKDIEKY